MVLDFLSVQDDIQGRARDGTVRYGRGVLPGGPVRERATHEPGEFDQFCQVGIGGGSVAHGLDSFHFHVVRRSIPINLEVRYMP